jgi:hypothetical protein
MGGAIGIAIGIPFIKNKVGPGAKIANDYNARVIADGGVVESLNCVIDGINNLDAI